MRGYYDSIDDMFKGVNLDKGLITKFIENRNLPGEEFITFMNDMEKNYSKDSVVEHFIKFLIYIGDPTPGHFESKLIKYNDLLVELFKTNSLRDK